MPTPLYLKKNYTVRNSIKILDYQFELVSSYSKRWLIYQRIEGDQLSKLRLVVHLVVVLFNMHYLLTK